MKNPSVLKTDFPLNVKIQKKETNKLPVISKFKATLKISQGVNFHQFVSLTGTFTEGGPALPPLSVIYSISSLALFNLLFHPSSKKSSNLIQPEISKLKKNAKFKRITI